MPDLNCMCDLHHSSWQHQILKPLSKAGIEPTSSWMLIRFVSTESRRELPKQLFLLEVFLGGTAEQPLIAPVQPTHSRIQVRIQHWGLCCHQGLLPELTFHCFLMRPQPQVSGGSQDICFSRGKVGPKPRVEWRSLFFFFFLPFLGPYCGTWRFPG